MQHPHPHAASIFSRILLGMMRLLRRSVTPRIFKSQQACITALAPRNALNAEKMLIHPLSWSSTIIRRVCRNRLMAETYALSIAVEHGLRKQATIVHMRGQLHFRQWEQTASAAVGHVWFADCESLFAQLISPDTNKSTTNAWRLTCLP